jgi:MoxR-like ATPase
MVDIAEINEKIKEKSSFVSVLKNEVKKRVVGQNYMIDRILIALFTDGHILLEGVPGLAKTLTVNTIAEAINLSFKRIQFTPDLLPADLTGSLIFDSKSGDFYPKKGPIFTNILLADEVNRAPAKVQSAMLESMQEKQVTLGNESHKLPSPFFVLATQNPIEQEGTYPLPEAQTDRFMLKIKVDYPTLGEEKKIMEMYGKSNNIQINKIIKPEDIMEVGKTIDEIYVDDGIKDYILRIVFATRKPEEYKLLFDLKQYIDFGASPRASLYLLKGAKALAFLKGRGFVTPDDIKEIAYDVLRHRIILSFEAEAEELSTEDIIKEILSNIEVP